MAEEALRGKPVRFTYKGVVFQLIPERASTSKLEGLIAQPTLAPNIDLRLASKELAAEMESAWMKDWAEI
jgi:hypothetical protein